MWGTLAPPLVCGWKLDRVTHNGQRDLAVPQLYAMQPHVSATTGEGYGLFSRQEPKLACPDQTLRSETAFIAVPVSTEAQHDKANDEGPKLLCREGCEHRCRSPELNSEALSPPLYHPLLNRVLPSLNPRLYF